MTKLLLRLGSWRKGKRQEEALWSARTPCEHCGAFCLTHELGRTWCAWCKQRSTQKPGD